MQGEQTEYADSATNGIDGILAQLEKQICYTQETVHTLEQRLEYVLRPASPLAENVPGNRDEIRTRSSLSMALEAMLSRVHHLTHQIVSISERVDL